MKTVLPQNLGKVLWPGGFTKGDLLEYLATVGVVMIPHLKDRPVTVIRYPDGIEEEGFFQKHPPPGTPDWVTRVKIGEGEAIVIDRLETLLWLGQLGAIEYHVTFSRFPTVDRPTYLVFDLDPSVEGFAAVCRAALMIRNVLTRLGLPAYPKTSGATGIQVYVPIRGFVTFEQTRPLMRTIAKYCEHQAPELITTERRVRARGDRVYIDYLQHAPNKTLIAPYSPRAVPTAAVSAPLQWEEVERGMAPETWTIATMAKRLQKMGDLFAPVLDPGVDIRPLLQHLKELLSKRSP